MDEFKELTKAEEQIMQALWNLGKGFVKDIIAILADPKPAYNTVSTIVRILETKGFVNHESFGKAHQYFPMVSKEAYKKQITGKLLEGYFENSASSMLSFFIQERKIDLEDVDNILNIIKKHKS